MAAPRGFEPRFTDPKSAVLPLDEGAAAGSSWDGPVRVGQENGAEDGTRTRDPHLGKVMLYQLSHFRPRSDHRIGGAESQNRTGDTAIFSRVLYQLSYLGPMANQAGRPSATARIPRARTALQRTDRLCDWGGPGSMTGAVPAPIRPRITSMIMGRHFRMTTVSIRLRLEDPRTERRVPEVATSRSLRSPPGNPFGSIARNIPALGRGSRWRFVRRPGQSRPARAVAALTRPVVRA